MHLTEEQSQQATLGLRQAGLGLRSAARDAPAAYLASLGTCSTACAELDAGFDAAAVPQLPAVGQALQMLNQALPADQAVLVGDALQSRQKPLPEKMDIAAGEKRLAAAEPGAKAV